MKNNYKIPQLKVAQIILTKNIIKVEIKLLKENPNKNQCKQLQHKTITKNPYKNHAKNPNKK